jgi:hypothetical protein
MSIICAVILICIILGLRFLFGTLKVFLCMEKRFLFTPVNVMDPIADTARSGTGSHTRKAQDTVLMTQHSQNYSVNRDMTLNSHRGI